MMAGTAVFTCNICGEPSTEICTDCTKDACVNHRCARCKRCSDCCECEVPLSATEVQEPEAVAEPARGVEATPAPEPEVPEAGPIDAASEPESASEAAPDEGIST